MNSFAAISSDGRRLAGVVDPGETAGSIWIADRKRHTFQKVTDMPASVRPRGAVWTPAGDRLNHRDNSAFEPPCAVRPGEIAHKRSQICVRYGTTIFSSFSRGVLTGRRRERVACSKL